MHMCGMGRDNEHATEYLISRGAQIEALDTYGMTSLHRMASNNLAVGAEALLKAGADPNNAGESGATPLQVAKESHARDVIRVLERYGGNLRASPKQPKGVEVVKYSSSCVAQPSKTITVKGSGNADVNQKYKERDPTVIPKGFDITCRQMSWDTTKMWLQLSDQRTPWYEAENGSYIYWNQGDGKWWIDAPDGGGVYIVKASSSAVPANGWVALTPSSEPAPTVQVE